MKNNVKHQLYCKNYIPDAPSWCENCINNGILASICSESDIWESIQVKQEYFDDTIFLVPLTKLHWMYSFYYLKQKVSFSISYKEINTVDNEYKNVFNEVVYKNGNTFSLHFIDHDIEIIRNLSIDSIKDIIKTYKPHFVFSPEIGPKINANNQYKLLTMLSYASHIGQMVPICFLFQGNTNREIQNLSKELEILKPSSVGIYAGSSIFPKLCENIKKIRELYPHLPLYAVSISNPRKIKELITYGATHFVISGWGRIGRKLRILDLEKENWTDDFKKIIKNCECESCIQYESFKDIQKLFGFTTPEILTSSLHNAIHFKLLIDKYKRDANN